MVPQSDVVADITRSEDEPNLMPGSEVGTARGLTFDSTDTQGLTFGTGCAGSQTPQLATQNDGIACPPDMTLPLDPVM